MQNLEEYDFEQINLARIFEYIFRDVVRIYIFNGSNCNNIECKKSGCVLLNIPEEDQNYVFTKTHTKIEI